MANKDNQPTIPADMIPEQSVASPAKPEAIIDAETNNNSTQASPEPETPEKENLTSDNGGQPHLADFRKKVDDFFKKLDEDNNNGPKDQLEKATSENDVNSQDTDSLAETESSNSDHLPTPEPSQSKAFDDEIGDTRDRQQQATEANNEKKAEAMDSAMSEGKPPQSMTFLNEKAANGMPENLGQVAEVAEEVAPLVAAL